MAKLGVIGFGGGSAMIPVFEKELVQDRAVLSDSQFTRHAVVANVTPGGLPTKLAGLAGLELAGVAGGVLGGFATALPGAVMVVGLIALFSVLGASGLRLIEYASVGISAYIVMVLAEYIVSTVRRAPSRAAAAAIVVVVFLATGINDAVELTGHLLGQRWRTDVSQLSSVAAVVAALVLIVLYSLLTARRRGVPIPPSGAARPLSPPSAATAGHSTDSTVPAANAGGSLQRDALITALILAGLAAAGLVVSWLVAGLPGLTFMALIALSIVATFGGGNAYIAVGAGFFVTSGMIAAETYYGQLVPVGNATPGALIMKLAAELGYVFGAEIGGVPVALILAVAAFIQGVAVSNLAAMLVFAGYERAAGTSVLRDISIFILPVICGMLVTTAIDMVITAARMGAQAGPSMAVRSWIVIAGVGVMWALHRKTRVPDLVLLAVGGAVSLGLLAAIGA